MRHKDLELIYKAEFDYAINDLCMYLKLSELLLNEQARQKISDMIRSYILYRRATSDTVSNLDTDLDALYLSITGNTDVPQMLTQTLRSAYRKKFADTTDPSAYDFLKQITQSI